MGESRLVNPPLFQLTLSGFSLLGTQPSDFWCTGWLTRWPRGLSPLGSAAWRWRQIADGILILLLEPLGEFSRRKLCCLYS